MDKVQTDKLSQSSVTTGGRLILASFRTFRCSATFVRSHIIGLLRKSLQKIFCASSKKIDLEHIAMFGTLILACISALMVIVMAIVVIINQFL